MHHHDIQFLHAKFNSILSVSIFLSGNIKNALEMTNELLKILPNHERANGNKAFYEKELAKEALSRADKMLRGDDGSPDIDETFEQKDGRQNPAVYTDNERRLYEGLCRNEIEPDISIISQLRCRYLTNKPFLRLAPLKFEEASLKPYIVIFLEVMYDSEIELIKQMAKPRVR